VTKPARRIGAYGVDAPAVILTFAVIAAVLLVVTALVFALEVPVLPWITLAGGLFCALTVANLLYTTLAGKFAVWSEILGRLGLRGDEKVLDVGCGRGAVLIATASRLPAGRAVGVDLWSGGDQSGNAPGVTTANAEAEGVRDRVRVVTGDATSLPFGDASFDLVVSSMAIHNIEDRARRGAALREVVRVLRPGGRVALVDFMVVGQYPEILGGAGLTELRIRPLGWRFWYGGPWLSASLVTGIRG